MGKNKEATKLKKETANLGELSGSTNVTIRIK
jgi:hypothetical protein